MLWERKAFLPSKLPHIPIDFHINLLLHMLITNGRNKQIKCMVKHTERSRLSCPSWNASEGRKHHLLSIWSHSFSWKYLYFYLFLRGEVSLLRRVCFSKQLISIFCQAVNVKQYSQMLFGTLRFPLNMESILRSRFIPSSSILASHKLYQGSSTQTLKYLI